MKKTKSTESQTYGKYLFAGVLAAVVIVIAISLIKDNEVSNTENKPYVWSAETDSLFVNDCYGKYKPQIKDDLVKQETTKSFCRCMLEKIKSKYAENEMDKVTKDDIKKWDNECRNKISNF